MSVNAVFWLVDLSPVTLTVIFKPKTKAAEALNENVMKIIETFKEAAIEDNEIRFSFEL